MFLLSPQDLDGLYLKIMPLPKQHILGRLLRPLYLSVGACEPFLLFKLIHRQKLIFIETFALMVKKKGLK